MPVDFKVYLITDRTHTRLPLPQAVRLAIEGGVRAIQLREKDLPVRDLLDLARELRKITRGSGASLFINDRVDIAVAVDADGVHLGQKSMPPKAARRVLGREKLIGVSTHTIVEAKEAEAGGADFITFGPVFFTPSKACFGAAVGLECLKSTKKSVSIPIFGLGGIKSGEINQVLQYGADGVSMISAIFGADDIRKAAEEIVAKTEQHETRQGI